MDVLVIGISVLDILVKPVTPEVFTRDGSEARIEFMPGGDALNVAVNAASMGTQVGLATTVGNDDNGRAVRRYLDEKGVDTSALKISERFPTGISLVLTEPDGERHFIADKDILQEITAGQVTEEMLDGVKILSMNSFYKLPALDDGGVIPLFDLAHEKGVLTALDTKENKYDNWLSRIEDTLYHTDIFLPSYEEASKITGRQDVQAMARAMKKYGMKIFGVKMGSRGSYVTDFKREYFVEPFPTEKVVNTVGAGDTYFAGFMTALVRGLDLYECALFASAAASYTVQTMGAQADLPKAGVIEDMIRQKSVRS